MGHLAVSRFRLQRNRVVLAAAMLIAAALAVGPGLAADLTAYVDSLNTCIKVADRDGCQWPRSPGGVRAFLFGGEAWVLPKASERNRSDIVFRDTTFAAGSPDGWYDAHLEREPDRCWTVRAVQPCEPGRVLESQVCRRKHRELAARSGFDFATGGPLAFLDSLRTSERSSITVLVIEFGWVGEADLPALIALLDSTERCANVASGVSSYIDQSWSTVGNEAAYLIDGYRQDRYPPGLNSTRPKPDVAGIRRWWEARGGH